MSKAPKKNRQKEATNRKSKAQTDRQKERSVSDINFFFSLKRQNIVYVYIKTKNTQSHVHLECVCGGHTTKYVEEARL